MNKAQNANQDSTQAPKKKKKIIKPKQSEANDNGIKLLPQKRTISQVKEPITEKKQAKVQVNVSEFP